MAVEAMPMDEMVQGENINERALGLLTLQGLAEEEEKAKKAKEELCRAMFVDLKSTKGKIHIEEGTSNSVRAFGVGRRGCRKVFTKEIPVEQDFKG